MNKKFTNIGLTVASLALPFVGAGRTVALIKTFGMMALGGLMSGRQTIKNGGNVNTDVTLDAQDAPIVKVWGRARVVPRLVWSSGLKKHTKKKRQGKGGPKIENTSYSVKLMYVVCMGTITRPERLKFNQEMIYDWNDGEELGCELTFADGYWSGETERGVKFRITPGTTDQPVDQMLQAAKGVSNWTSYPGQCTLAIEIPDLARYGDSIPTVTLEVYNSETGLSAVILEIASWVGREPQDFDLSQLESETVAPTPSEGFTADSRQAAGDLTAQLMALHNFDLPEVDGVLRAVKRGGDVVAILEENDLRVRAGYERGERATLNHTQAEDTALSQYFEAAGRDPGREGYQGVRDARRTLTTSHKKVRTGFSATIMGDRLAGVAREQQAQEYAMGEMWDGTLGVEHLDKSPADRIQLQTKNGVVDMILDTLTTPMFGPIATKLVGFDPLSLGLPLPPDTAGFSLHPPATIGVPIGFFSECTAPPSSSMFWNTPAIIGGVTHLPDDEWTGGSCNIDRQKFGETTWKEFHDPVLDDTAVIGELTAPYEPTLPQDGFTGDTISCKMLGGDNLYSAASLDDVEEGANLILFEGGVLVSFRDATQGPSIGNLPTYTLTTLKGARFGSDDLMAGTLPTGTRFMLLTDEEGNYESGVHWFDFPKASSLLGDQLRVRLNAADVSGAAQVIYPLGTFEGRNVEMPSPIIYEATRLEDGGLRLRGIARTRRNEDMSQNDQTRLGDIGAPRFEAGYKYLLDMEADGAARAVTKYSTDDRADFDWTLTAEELETLFGEAPAELSGTLALTGPYGLGRTAAWQQTMES